MRGLKLYELGVIVALETAAGGHTDIGGFYDLGTYLLDLGGVAEVRSEEHDVVQGQSSAAAHTRWRRY